MKTLYVWEKIILGIVAVASFFAGLSISLIDAVMALAINTLIAFGLFKIGNKIFQNKNADRKQKEEQKESVAFLHSVPVAKKQKIILAISSVFFVIFIFSWYEIRPTIIKSKCSSVEYIIPATPAFAGVTKEEAEKINAKTEALRRKWRKENGFDVNCEGLAGIDGLRCQLGAGLTGTAEEKPAIPAQPTRKATRNANDREYQACVRHYGL